MIVLILEKVPATLRGELSRWLIEPRHGVFVGAPSAMVRDRLWGMVTQKVNTGGALLLYSYPNEQGFKANSTGETTRSLTDNEGLLMVHIPTEQAKKKDTAAARTERRRAAARHAPDTSHGDVAISPASPEADAATPAPSAKRPSSRPRPLGKTHPLYGHQGPGDGADIALYRQDPGYSSETMVLDGCPCDPALAPVGVRWRTVTRV